MAKEKTKAKKREEEVKEAVEKADAETTQDFEGMWKRALADYQNLTKEMSAERIRMRRDALVDVVTRLLPILDNFASATAHEPESDDSKVKNWVAGVGFIRKQMEDMLGEFGLERIETDGKPFDASLMEAVGEEEAEGESGTVLRETIAGFKLGETIIRPAKVITVK